MPKKLVRVEVEKKFPWTLFVLGVFALLAITTIWDFVKS